MAVALPSVLEARNGSYDKDARQATDRDGGTAEVAEGGENARSQRRIALAKALGLPWVDAE